MVTPTSPKITHEAGPRASGETSPILATRSGGGGGGSGGGHSAPSGTAAAVAWNGGRGRAVSAGGGLGLAPIKTEAIRVVAHIDMDAFYAQIEQVRDPALTGKPVVVVQYPTTMHNIRDMSADDHRIVQESASSLIAVSYEARKFGVKRGMKAVEAQEVCDELIMVQVPTRNAKADISLYRQNGEKVVTVLEQAGGELVAVEKASIDEVYVDVTRAARALLKSLVGSFAEVVARGSAEGPVVSPAVAPEKASERQSSEFGLTEVGEKDDVGGERRSEMPSSEDDQNGSGEDVGDQGYRGRSLENEEENMAKKGRTVGDSDSGFGGRMLEGGDNVGDAGGRDRDSEIEATSKEGAGDSEIEATSKEGAVDSEDEGDLARKKELLEAWQGRGRWEEIGAGGWAAVFSEVIGTHVAGVDDKNQNHEGEGASSRGDKRISWWRRPKEVWTEDEKLLACGTAVVSRLRAAVRSELSYSCTAGVAHNKLLAKLCSNMHKPNAQTVLPLAKVGTVFAALPVQKVKGWGGKLGEKIMEKLGVTTAGEVGAAGPAELQRVLGEVDGWRAWEKSRGIDRDPVKARSQPKSIGCSKTFPGKTKLTTLVEVERWVSELSKELCLRLNEHEKGEGQTPKTLTVMFGEWQKKGRPKAVSRCCRMVNAEVPAVMEACMKMLKAYKKEPPCLAMLGVSAHGFEETRAKNTPTIESFFGGGGGARGAREDNDKIKEGPVVSPETRRLMASTPTSSSSGSSNGKHTAETAAAADIEIFEDCVRGVDSVNGGVDESRSIFAVGKDETVVIESDDVMPRGWLYDEGSMDGAESEVDAGENLLEGQHGGVEAERGVRETGEDKMGRGGSGAEREEDGAWEHWPTDRAGERDEAGRGSRDDSHRLCDVQESESLNHNMTQGFLEDEMKTTDRVSEGENGGGESRQLLFGRGGASGGFGIVDPDVLSELPPDIQREVWMQQGGRGMARSGQHGGAKRPRPSGGGGGGGRRRAGRGGGRAREPNQGSISSFLGR